ncbi:unnamed protein product [Diamesa serratosioi]
MKLIISLLTLSVAINICTAQVFGRCNTPDQYRGECVYLKSCAALVTRINKKPLAHEDRLFLSLSQCGYRDRQPLVCCRPVENVTPVTPAPVAPPPRNNLLPRIGVCGIDAEDRIYGGERTKVNEYPWMALLQYSKPNNKKGFHCGGVLISENYVLTASHCVNGKDLPTTWQLTGVRLGEWDTTTENDCDDSFVNENVCAPPAIDIQIEQLIPHENYQPNAGNQHNDIALLRLAQKVTFNEFVAPICLPFESAVRNNNFVNQTLSVAGWGKTESVSASNLKLKVNVDGVTNSKCQDIYGSQNREIVGSQVCAGGLKGKDSCRGDSGGPLMRQNVQSNPPYWYLAGLVSYGPSPCGQEGWPGVYTRVGNYVDWVESNLKP